jgi:hypothetical protein
MVFIIDQGSVFDAPLEKIWRYMTTADEQQHQHNSIRNVQYTQEGDHGLMTFDTPGPG